MMSEHARARSQQRAISEEVVDCLLAYGAVDYHRGREIYWFDKRGWKRLLRERSIPPQQQEKLRNCYAVLDDAEVVTVGHRYRHFRRCRH